MAKVAKLDTNAHPNRKGGAFVKGVQGQDNSLHLACRGEILAWEQDYWQPTPPCVFYGVPRPAGLTVVDGDHPRRVVNHPLVPSLKTIPTVSRADETHQVGPFHHPAITLLPFPAPAALKPSVGAGADESDFRSLVPECQHDLRRPEIDPSCHP